MLIVEHSALVTHRAEEMFTLVNDVQRYAEFLPWCGRSEELSRTENEVIASITIAFKGINQAFTTKNQLIGTQKTEIALIDGPFSTLSGYWEFTPLTANASKITLNLKFDFSSKIAASVIGPVFKKIADSMIESFCKRADDIYPPSESDNIDGSINHD